MIVFFLWIQQKQSGYFPLLEYDRVDSIHSNINQSQLCDFRSFGPYW